MHNQSGANTYLRKRLFYSLLLVVCACQLAVAQKQTTPPPLRQTVVVTGNWEPIPLEESDRSVNSYSLKDSFLLFGSLADGLDLDSSVQVQSRAPGGIQGDI